MELEKQLIVKYSFEDFMEQKIEDEFCNISDFTGLEWKYIWLSEYIFNVITYNNQYSLDYGKDILKVLTYIRDFRSTYVTISKYDITYDHYLMVINILCRYGLIDWTDDIDNAFFDFVGYDFNFTFIRCLVKTETIDNTTIKIREANCVDWSKEAVDYLIDEFFRESETYDICLLEKPEVDGLDRNDITRLLNIMDPSAQIYPIDLESRRYPCSAMGFITSNAAEKLDYDYEKSGLHDFIATILDTTPGEGENTPDIREYTFKGLRIHIGL